MYPTDLLKAWWRRRSRVTLDVTRAVTAETPGHAPNEPAAGPACIAVAVAILTFAMMAVPAVAAAIPVTPSPGASSAELPVSFLHPGLRALERIDGETMPYVDVAALEAEDVASSVPRSRFPITVDLSPSNSGTWERIPTGGMVWRLRLESAGARYLTVGFDVFDIPEGAVVHLYNPSKSALLGGFVAGDQKANGQLWSTSIRGDVAIVELYWPDVLQGQEPALHIGTVSHVYERLLISEASLPEGEAGGSDTGYRAQECSPDVNCPLGLGIEDIKRGAVRVYLGRFGVICSGSLINNVNDDRTPYILTAEHCLAKVYELDPSDDLSASETLFNFERPGCGPPPDAPPDDDRISGVIFRSMYDLTDFALVEIDGTIPSRFCARLNGWTRATVVPDQVGTIHQPAGGPPKKVSVDLDYPEIYSSFWRIREWEIGNTRSGSSGAPLFNRDGRILGQLCCGGNGDPPACRQDLDDLFGRFDQSWGGGGTPDTRLRDWLDPGNVAGLSHYGIEAADNPDCREPSEVGDNVLDSGPAHDSGERGDRPAGSPPLLKLLGATSEIMAGRVALSLNLLQEQDVRVRVYDTAGRVVARLLDSRLSAGDHQLTWEPATAGTAVPAGTYFVLAQAGSERASRKVVIAW